MGKVIDLLDHVDKCGNIPLHTSAANGYSGLVTFFLDIGSNPRKKNKNNHTKSSALANPPMFLCSVPTVPRVMSGMPRMGVSPDGG